MENSIISDHQQSYVEFLDHEIKGLRASDKVLGLINKALEEFQSGNQESQYCFMVYKNHSEDIRMYFAQSFQGIENYTILEPGGVSLGRMKDGGIIFLVWDLETNNDVSSQALIFLKYFI